MVSWTGRKRCHRDLLRLQDILFGSQVNVINKCVELIFMAQFPIQIRPFLYLLTGAKVIPGSGLSSQAFLS
jgi:hypothetical protein